MLTSVFAPSIVAVRHYAPLVPAEFFQQIRAGLWVSGDFLNAVVAKARVVEAGTTFTVKLQTLGRAANDTEIEDPVIGLGPNHLFDETALCGVAAGLIKEQSQGEGGALLNDGKVILFYLSSGVVRMRWRTVSREWDLHPWQRNNRHEAGSQIVSPA